MVCKARRIVQAFQGHSNCWDTYMWPIIMQFTKLAQYLP
jgi:hypothetical protein